MIIKTPLIENEDKCIVYPQGAEFWKDVKTKHRTMIGTFTGSLYVEGEVKAFDWELYDPDLDVDYGSVITVLAYRTRWKLQEQAMLDLISIDDPAASMQDRLQKATLRQVQVNLAAATEVDLSDERVRSGALSVLKALHDASPTIVPNAFERMRDILDTPVNYNELPENKKSLYGKP